MIHELKTHIEYFQWIRCDLKNFELRFNDRNFQPLDELLLKEYDPETKEYTGRILHRKIEYILHGGKFGLEPGFIIMSLRKL